MPVIDLNSLLIFAKVVEVSSFSEAARRLQMPLSTVSRRVADLEDQLGVRLLERSTRLLRLTEIGNELYGHARRTLELRDAVDNIVTNKMNEVAGVLRISAPPSMAEEFLTPLVCAFQSSYPNVRVQIVITERHLDHIADEIDLAFRVGALKDSSLVARTLLTYRHRLLASPAYLEEFGHPTKPAELAGHRLITFSCNGGPDRTWTFAHASGTEEQALSFPPYLSMNDFVGVAAALTRQAGIGELPPVVLPELVADGRLVEVMPEWRFAPINLSLIHLSNRHMSRPVRVFKEFATQMVPSMFPSLPT
jgi:DNA-binding transcriptional LysR family regulator